MNILANAARILSYYFECGDLIVATEQVPREGTLRGKIIRLGDAAVKAVSLTCRAACAVGRVGGASPQTLHSLKQVEKGARFCEIGTTLMTASKDSRRWSEQMGFQNSFFHVVNCLERIARPLVSFARVSAEMNAYHEEISHDSDHSPSHLETEANYIASSHHRAIGEALLQVNTLSYLAIVHELARAQALQQDRDEQLALHGDADPTNLLPLSFIPSSLHGDPVFKENICPITLTPIRHPVREPHGVAVYERSAIERALESDPRSPLTRLPLHREDLIPQEAMQRRINDRLTLYQTMFQNRISSFMETH